MHYCKNGAMTDDAAYDPDEDLTDDELAEIWERAGAVELVAPVDVQSQSYDFIVTPAPENVVNGVSGASLLIVTRTASPASGTRVTTSTGRVAVG